MITKQWLVENHDRVHALFGAETLLGRFSCVENSIIQNYLTGKGFTEYSRQMACKHVGLSPPNDRVLTKFCELYLEALEASDLISLPHYGDAQGKETLMKQLQQKYCPLAQEIEYNIMEDPFCYSEYPKHWIHILKNKRILIVSPLKDSIEQQLPKIKDIYSKVPLMTPEWQSVVVIKSPLTQSEFSTTHSLPENLWIDELERMKREITDLADSFDIAILGCGGYAMPLCLHIKSLHRSSIMYGGALQLLFGIIGKRWEIMSKYRAIMTPAWIRPSDEERPVIWKEIEGGCYW